MFVPLLVAGPTFISRLPVRRPAKAKKYLLFKLHYTGIMLTRRNVFLSILFSYINFLRSCWSPTNNISFYVFAGQATGKNQKNICCLIALHRSYVFSGVMLLIKNFYFS
jgi:hypothetical protein